MKLSSSFNLKDFIDCNDKRMTQVQLMLLKNLARNILEPIQKIFNCKLCVMKGGGGVRFPSDLNKLKKSGYTPSETSDHLIGNTIRLRSRKKKEKFGEYFGYSIGAADIVPNIPPEIIFEAFKKKFNPVFRCAEFGNEKIHFGQCILESGPNQKWIHISNPYTLMYSKVFVDQFLNKPPFSVCSDNGRTYS